jgi:glutamyl-tRNA synthetase
MVIVRFAPSPTGLMHFGNVRTALFNYLYAKQQNGALLLRIEDTDQVRSEERYLQALLEDLQWLGLDWQQGPYFQSQRREIYDRYYTELETAGLAYPCFCSEAHLALTRKVQLASGQPPRYPGTCRHLTSTQRAQKCHEGIQPTLRFALPEHQSVKFTDAIKGEQVFATQDIGDFIIRRADGSAAFMFSNAIDDALMGVTHALRGDDHLSNTPRQILIAEALGLKYPIYGHFPTILGADGAKLSKRNGSRHIQALREEGYQALGIVNYLARLGHHYEEAAALQTLEALGAQFQLSHISHSPAHFDEHQLNFWQKEAMHHCAAQAFWTLIAPQVSHCVSEAQRLDFVAVVQPNIVMPREAKLWAEALFLPHLDPKPEKTQDPEFFKIAIALWQSGLSTQEFLSQLQQQTQKKGKALFAPLRLALTGQDAGPELKAILELMGSERVLQRFYDLI